MLLHVNSAPLVKCRCASAYPGWWCCRTPPPRCGRRYKTPGATPPSPGTGWTRPGGRGRDDPVRWASGALWRSADFRPAAPQNHTANPKRVQQMIDNVMVIKSASKKNPKKQLKQEFLKTNQIFIQWVLCMQHPDLLNSLKGALQSPNARHKHGPVCTRNGDFSVTIIWCLEMPGSCLYWWSRCGSGANAQKWSKNISVTGEHLKILYITTW